MHAFWELGTDRQIGGGVGPVPLSSIERYADRHGMTPDEERDFRVAIRAMDREYLDWQAIPADKRPIPTGRNLEPGILSALFG